MKQYDVIIVGGSAGGLTTALSARVTYPEKSILVIRKEEKILVPCGIPYIFNTLKTVEDNRMGDATYEKHSIDLLIDTVEDVKIEEKILKLKKSEDIKYEKLVLATGSKPFVLPVKGIDSDGVYFIKKEIEYLRDLKEKISLVNNIVVVGGGFIGVEVSEELARSGKNVTLIEKQDQLLPLTMDEDFTTHISKLLENTGVKVLRNTGLKEIVSENNKVVAVNLDNNTKLNADLIIVAAGYRPNTELAKHIGLNVTRYGIEVDEYLRTSVKDIYAVGDCTAKRHFLTNNATPLMLASTASIQGRQLGSNLFRIKIIKEFPGFIGTFSTKINGVVFASAGITERDAKEADIDYVVGISDSVDKHPGKLPNASKIHLKLIFSKYSHQILGAQITGGDSVGELINTLSILIQDRKTDSEIQGLQFGTHPLLTASPVIYPVMSAILDLTKKWYK